MKHSQLVAIIKRLEAMTESTYDNTTETFELTESDSKQSYQFDNIDIVAMEIYDLIQ